MKPNAMSTYAIERRKKYEEIAGRELKMPELISAAKSDWDAEPQHIREKYKEKCKKGGSGSSNKTPCYTLFQDCYKEPDEKMLVQCSQFYIKF